MAAERAEYSDHYAISSNANNGNTEIVSDIWKSSAHTARRRSVIVIIGFGSDLENVSVSSKPCAAGIHQDGG